MNLTVIELENKQLEPSDIVVRDETNVMVKINGYEYFNSLKVPMDFEMYHQVSNNYLLKTSKSIQRR
jgi:hypothetical protein